MRLDSSQIGLRKNLPSRCSKEIRLLKERENREKLSKVRWKMMSRVDEW